MQDAYTDEGAEAYLKLKKCGKNSMKVEVAINQFSRVATVLRDEILIVQRFNNTTVFFYKHRYIKALTFCICYTNKIKPKDGFAD